MSSTELDPVLAYGVVMPPKREGAQCSPTLYGLSQLYAEEGNFAWYTIGWSQVRPGEGIVYGGELSVHSMFVWPGQVFASVEEAMKFIEVRSQ